VEGIPAGILSKKSEPEASANKKESESKTRAELRVDKETEASRGGRLGSGDKHE